MMTKQEDDNIRHNKNITLIRPLLHTVGPFELSALDQAVEIGYREAKKILG
jgi:hypothetical protein